MLDSAIETFRDAVAGIDRAYVIEMVGIGVDALPFDYKIALGYALVGIGAYCFLCFAYRYITEPERTTKTTFMGSADKRFMLALKEAVTPYQVFPNVAVNSVLNTRSLSPKRRKKTLAMTAPLRYDFLICSDDMQIVAAVDFREKKRMRSRAVKRGLKAKRSASQQSGLPLITFDRKYAHSADSINQHISSATIIPRNAQIEPDSGTENSGDPADQDNHGLRIIPNKE